MIPVLKGQAALDWIKAAQTGAAQAAGLQQNGLASTVSSILKEVHEGGDDALKQIAERLKDPAPRTIRIDSPFIARCISSLPETTKQTIEFAAGNIRRFAQAIMDSLKPVRVQFAEYAAGLDLVPVERCACYVPCGRYPLPSTALMTAITAQVAGVKDIALFTPALKPEIVFAGTLAGVSEFHELGGAQAIAAAAYGTESIGAADIIVGPGNAYVAEAKRQVQGIVGIDMLAGPSEIAVIADGEGDPDWVALDLLSQAEHDPDARAYLLTDSEQLADIVAAGLPAIASSVGAPPFVSESLARSAILVLPSLAECIWAANTIAPEHLVLHVGEPEKIRGQLKNFGALFIGYCATVPYGDYAAGPNHTLPTNRSARFSGGLTPLTFLRPQSWLDIKAPAKQLARQTAAFARLEGLKAHEAAAAARIDGAIALSN
ncbi:MAG TPA: histidinol dehydrogenase [Candidatus Obscuribacterales bacterium]